MARELYVKPAFESDTPDQIVPCRQCGAPVELHGAAIDIWVECNRRLEKIGEEPLAKNEIVRCERKSCRQVEVSNE